MYFKRMTNKIVITRPTVSNEDNGFLPGSLEEKPIIFIRHRRPCNNNFICHTLKIHV
jgi:phosphate starvation-inducible protein PhoH